MIFLCRINSRDGLNQADPYGLQKEKQDKKEKTMLDKIHEVRNSPEVFGAEMAVKSLERFKKAIMDR